LLLLALLRLGFDSFCLEATDGLPVGLTGDLAAMLGKYVGMWRLLFFGGLEVRVEESISVLYLALRFLLHSVKSSHS
jgi:hypothetical protein